VEGDTVKILDGIQFSLFQSTPSVWRETASSPVGYISFAVFQSTPSVWRETADVRFPAAPNQISIHSLRVEGDRNRFSRSRTQSLFQSTPSVWRETCSNSSSTLNSSSISIHSLRVEGDDTVPTGQQSPQISIHSLRVEGDAATNTGYQSAATFQSTPSVWRETLTIISIILPYIFQSTPSVWRETILLSIFCHHFVYFNPLPPCGGRPFTAIPHIYSR